MTPSGAAGVLMLPVERAGVLSNGRGQYRRAGGPGITGLSITIPLGHAAAPPPLAGDRYLGFLFAEAGTRHDVEQALVAARRRLRVVIG